MRHPLPYYVCLVEGALVMGAGAWLIVDQARPIAGIVGYLLGAVIVAIGRIWWRSA